MIHSNLLRALSHRAVWLYPVHHDCLFVVGHQHSFVVGHTEYRLAPDELRCLTILRAEIQQVIAVVDDRGRFGWSVHTFKLRKAL